MHYDTKVRIAEISVILVILLTIGSCMFFGISELSKQANIRKIQQKTLENSMANLDGYTTTNQYISEIKDPIFQKHQKFFVENDCWVFLVVRNLRKHVNFHYQCLKGPHYYTYRSVYYYPNRDYYNHIEGMTEAQRIQKQIAVNKKIKPNYFLSAH